MKNEVNFIKDLEKYTDNELLDMIEPDNNRRNPAFRELYYRYAKSLHLFSRHNSYNYDVAQNAFQEAWITLFENLIAGKKIQSVSAFLVTVCRRRIIDNIRKAGESPVFVTVTEIEDTMEMIEEDDSATRNQLIENAIDSLEEKYREAFIMNKINGLKISEIAEITGESTDCIKKRVSRATEKVKIIIQKQLKRSE